MASYEIQKLLAHDFPAQLNELPQPPKELYLSGKYPDLSRKLLAVVGSRKFTPYGQEVCQNLIQGLHHQPITIVSGLALGIDSIAHQAALSAGLPTIAFPGSGLQESVLYPASNRNLAKEIIDKGGCMFSEFSPETKAANYTFPQRNRLMAGISQAVLVIEAERKSGTLITSKLALEYNKDVLAVPGSIFSQNSSGPNWLIKNGATPIVESADIIEALGLEAKESPTNLSLEFLDLSPDEKLVIELLNEPQERDALLELSNLEIETINSTLTILEIKGLIKENAGKIYRQL